MKTRLLYCAITICIHYSVFAQANPTEFHIVSKLENYFSIYDPEKAYLQFDRPYYAAGDTIFFKAYVTEGGRHQLSGLSGVLHVDFIHPDNQIGQSLVLRLDSGVCWGDFALPDSLAAGNYRIRAYTRWMLNLGEMDFFDQNIFVGSIIRRNGPDSLVKPSRLAANHPADLQFFPEGGTLVEGVETKLAFKSTSSNGMGIPVKGVILDQENKPVCSFASSHLGMGYVVFTPERNHAYTARLTFADGTQHIVDLPKAEASGISLSVNNDGDSAILIRITVNEAYYKAHRNQNFILVIYSGGKAISYSSKQEDPVVALNMDRKLLQTGVATITLFSPEGEPVCERLIFVQNHDLLRLAVQTDQTVYQKKERVNLLLEAKTLANLPARGHYSLTVLDESQMPVDENRERTILTNLLLTSDLTGYVEQPNSYFNDTSEKARNNLDALMLTQGYRDFEWKTLLAEDSVTLDYTAEKGLEISGKITNLSNKPIAQGTVTLIPSGGGSLLSTISDQKGLFHFSNLIFTDTAHLVLSAVNSKGGNTTRITYLHTDLKSPAIADQPYTLPDVEDTSMLFYLEEARKWHEETLNQGTGRVTMLKPVTVKAIKLDNQYRTQSFAGAGHADQVMHAPEIEMIGGKLSTSLNGRLLGVNFINGFPFLQSHQTLSATGPMLIILDGTEMNSAFSIDDIPSTEVETVEVLKYASAGIYGGEGANGVLIITTKDGSEENKDIVAIGVLPIAPVGFYKARTFYSPKYEHAQGDAAELERRSTIYWNPEIQTDEAGHADIEYYNAGRAGTYKVIVEGIDENGHIGRVVYRYRVE